MDETPTHDNVSETQSRDYASSRNKITSPVSPLPPTGAPTDSPSSTRMWDELEAIKRRLRQLEMGSPLSGERPQTRGTTNSSSSPQRSSPYPASQAGTSITSSTSSPPSYPLLNAAITKVKSSGLSSDVAQAIEATAQEAMALALMTNHDPSVQAPSPRSIRRKVDGVCRGLTEVCLALADHQSTTQRQKTRAAQHRAEDAQDSSPLSATSRQAMTLSRTTARRLSGQTNSSTLSRSRRPAHSVVGITAEDLPDDDGISIVSRPSLSRYSTIQYRPPSRAATEVFRETTPPISNLQRYSTNRRSLLSRHGPSLSEYNIPVQNPASDIDSPHEEDPHPVKRSATFTAADADSRRRSLNLVSYFNSPPRTRATELSRESGLPTPPKRPVSLISPPRVNVASTFSSAERRDSTIRRRGLGGSVVGVEKPYETDIDELGRVRRNIGVASDLRRNASLSRKYGAREE